MTEATFPEQSGPDRPKISPAPQKEESDALAAHRSRPFRYLTLNRPRFWDWIVNNNHAIAGAACGLLAACGIWVAFYNYDINNLLADETNAQFQQWPATFTPVAPLEQMVGVVFGLGLAFIAAYAWSYLRRAVPPPS